jgi:integral membrane protein
MSSLFDLRGLAGALARYRLLAYIVGTALVILVCVGVPLQAAGHDGVVKVAGAIHGFLFIVYLLLIVDLTRRARLPLLHMLLVMLAGLVPFATFYAEYRTTNAVRAKLPAAADGPRGKIIAV